MNCVWLYVYYIAYMYLLNFRFLKYNVKSMKIEIKFALKDANWTVINKN